MFFTPGPKCENLIIDEINHAKKIDIAVYSITNQKIADSIFAAHNRGARVRIITGSYNWTLNATKHNSENCIVLSALGPDFSRRFEYLWDLYGN